MTPLIFSAIQSTILLFFSFCSHNWTVNFNCLISRCENETKNNRLQWQCIDVKQFFIAAFVVYFFDDKEKKYCFCMSSRKMMIIKAFGLQHLPWLALLMNVPHSDWDIKPWQHEIWGLYTFTSYILLKTTSFVMVGSSFPKDDHSLSENIHAHIRTSTTLEDWWQAAQPELSFQSTFTVW